MPTDLDRIIDKPVAAGQVAGVCAAAVLPGGSLWQGAAGEMRADSGTPMTEHAVFWIASMTKAVTGAALMQLVEQGRVALDEPAVNWVSELADVQVLDGVGDDGQVRLRAPASAPTVRQLLTHTGGFGYDMWSHELAAWRAQVGPSAPGQLTLEPLLFDPGTSWAYGTGIDWAGRIVEEVSGLRLGAYFSRNLFDPLGMTDTTFRVDDAQRHRVAPVHVRTDAGLVATDFAVEPSDEHEMGGGGLYGTVSDYLRFCQMILGDGAFGGERVLQAETVRLMAENHMGSLRMQDLPTSAPEMTHALRFFPESEKTWGLTFMRNEQRTNHGRRAGTLAWAGLANTYYWIDRSAGTAGVWATQLFPFNDPACVDSFYEFEAACR